MGLMSGAVWLSCPVGDSTCCPVGDFLGRAKPYSQFRNLWVEFLAVQNRRRRSGFFAYGF